MIIWQDPHKMKLTIWQGILLGFALNILAGLLLLLIMPLEYWNYGHGAHGSWWDIGTSPRLGYRATGPNLIEFYLSGFIHLGGLGGLIGGWIDYQQRKEEVLKSLRRVLTFFLGLAVFFFITGSLYLLDLAGLLIGSQMLNSKYIASEMGGGELYIYLSPLHLFGSRVPYFLLLVCLLLGSLIYIMEFSQLAESAKRWILAGYSFLGLAVIVLFALYRIEVIILVIPLLVGAYIPLMLMMILIGSITQRLTLFFIRIKEI